MAFDAKSRWRALFLSLNDIEAQADDPERILMARVLHLRVGPEIRPWIVLRPPPGYEREVGPACHGCASSLVSTQLMVACTVCLDATHWECWRRRGGCPTPACVRERAGLSRTG